MTDYEQLAKDYGIDPALVKDDGNPPAEGIPTPALKAPASAIPPRSGLSEAHIKTLKDLGVDPAKLNQTELTLGQRDVITRWGLDPRKFSYTTAPEETEHGLRDPATGELVVAGKPPGAADSTWGPLHAVANGLDLGFGPEVSAAVQSIKPGAPAGAYDQAKARYETDRASYNAEHPGLGLGGELAGSLATTVPLMLGGGAAIGAAGRAATEAAPALEALAPAARWLTGQGGGATAGSNLLMRLVGGASRAGSLASGGAVAGATNGLLTHGLSDESLAHDLGAGAAVGAGLGVGLPALAGAAGVGYRLGHAATDPFFDAGREALANNALYRVSVDPARAGTIPANLITGADEKIAGSVPTLAQATGNPALAATERALRGASPEFNTRWTERDQANKLARKEAMDTLEGDPETLNVLRQERDNEADPLRKYVMNTAGRGNPSGTVDTIDRLLQSPAAQEDAVKNALNAVRKKLVKQEIDLPDGSPLGQKLRVLEDDPEQLYGIRKAIGTLEGQTSTRPEHNFQLAARQLHDVKASLTDDIEAAAPGFKDYLAKYSEMSRPIDVQEFLQRAKTSDSDTNVTKGLTNQLIDTIKRGQALPGANRAKAFGPEEMAVLTNLHADLRRSGNSLLGKAAGSDTHQNIATNNLLTNYGLPLGLIGSVATGNPWLAPIGWAANKIYASKDKQIFQKVADMMLDPSTSLRAPVQRGVSWSRDVARAAPLTIPAGTNINHILSLQAPAVDDSANYRPQ